MGWNHQLVDILILYNSLRIQVCPKKGINPNQWHYGGDGIGTINPTLGRGLDS